MGNDEPVTPTKSDKASSPMQDQPIVHPYPDWAAMQAYYSSGVPVPPPYFNCAVTPGHPPHPYIWGPQPLIPPFVTPYAAIYPHGVYPHPLVSPMVSPLATDVSAKTSNIRDRGLSKKLKGFDGLAVSIGNVNSEIAVADGSGRSQSGENGAEGSSDARDENNESGGKENQRERISEDKPTSGDSKAGLLANATGNMSKGVIVPPSIINCKPLCTLPASPQMKTGALPEPCIQDEREFKREKRKQSNRESARRSRLRKQAETEELAVKVDTLRAENTSLRSEITRFKDNLEKMRTENSSLMAKLKDVEENYPDKLENQEVPSVVVENFLSRIDEARPDEDHENSNSGKLRQLLVSNPRIDPVDVG